MSYNLKEILSLQIDVSYQDTDVAGIVYHSNYLDYAEKARAKIFRTFFGILKDNSGQVWVVKNMVINYIKPATINDSIMVKTTVKEIKNASVVFLHSFFVGGVETSNITAQLVNLDGNFKPARMSKDVINKLNLILEVGNFHE